jgi:hypothetical protein
VPARPSGKGRIREGKAFGSAKAREIKSGTRREVELEQGLTAFNQNFYINLGRAAFGEMLILT